MNEKNNVAKVTVIATEFLGRELSDLGQFPI
jgi:hypothetical protein